MDEMKVELAWRDMQLVTIWKTRRAVPYQYDTDQSAKDRDEYLATMTPEEQAEAGRRYRERYNHATT